MGPAPAPVAAESESGPPEPQSVDVEVVIVTPVEVDDQIDNQTSAQAAPGLEAPPPASEDPETPSEDDHDCVKYRKGIRMIAVVDFCVAFVMLFLLSFGFFRVRMEATGDKSVQAFILAMYGLYSIQILVSIILYKGTHKEQPTVVARAFKQWSTTSNFLNVMLCAEVYFFILIVEGRTMISMALCFAKVIFRGIAVQLVNYSIREMQGTLGTPGGHGHHGESNGIVYDDFSSSLLLSSDSRGSFTADTTPAAMAEYKIPPPAYEAPPKYEEAMKLVDEAQKR